MVERFDDDGNLVLELYRNPDWAVAYRSLSPFEVDVLERLALGLSTRRIAYDMTATQSVVSDTLAQIASKLGLRSRVAVATFARLCVPDRGRDSGVSPLASGPAPIDSQIRSRNLGRDTSDTARAIAERDTIRVGQRVVGSS